MNGLAKRPNSILFNRVARYRDERAATDTSYVISLPGLPPEKRIAQREKEENEIKGRVEKKAG